MSVDKLHCNFIWCFLIKLWVSTCSSLIKGWMHLLAAILHFMSRKLRGQQVKCFSFTCFYNSEKKSLLTLLVLSAKMLIDFQVTPFIFWFFLWLYRVKIIFFTLGDLPVKKFIDLSCQTYFPLNMPCWFYYCFVLDDCIFYMQTICAWSHTLDT